MANYGKKAQALRDLVVDGSGPDLYFTGCWPSLRALNGVVRRQANRLCRDGQPEGKTPQPLPSMASNVYGFISYGKNLCGEWVRLLRAVKPTVARAAVVYDMDPARYNAKWVYDEILAQAQNLSSEA